MRTRPVALLAMFVGVASAIGLISCGTASVKELLPTPTPNPIDTTFRAGVLGKMVKPRDCDRAGCHTDDFGAPAGQLTLGSTSGTSLDQIYYLLINSGGTSQRGGGDKDVNT